MAQRAGGAKVTVSACQMSVPWVCPACAQHRRTKPEASAGMTIAHVPSGPA